MRIVATNQESAMPKLALLTCFHPYFLTINQHQSMSPTDNTLAAANNLGTLPSPINISDVIGGTDPVSYYKFTFPENSDIAGTVD